MKKLLHIPNYYPPHIGGIEDVCCQIVSGLKGIFEQKVICFGDKKETTRENWEGIEVRRCGVWRKILRQSISLDYENILKQILTEWQPDFVHLHLPNPWVSVWVLRNLPKQTRLIIHWHSDIVDWKQQVIYFFYRFWENKILKRADKIVVTSPNYLESSKVLQPFENKVAIIPNVVNEAKLLLREGDKDKISGIRARFVGQKIIFAFGRHIKYKGFEYLIKAMKLLKSEAVLVLAGEGPLTDKLRKIATEQSDRIKFVGRLSDDELRQYFYAAQVFAFPSITRNEAFGIALAEAEYCGLPVVTFTIDGSGVNWVSLNGETGIEVKNGNVVEYAAALDRLLMDEDLRRRLGERAAERAKNNFIWDKIKDRVFELYE